MRKILFGVLVLGGIAGALLTVAVDEANKYTAGDAFCTSCHAMSAYIADDPIFKAARHQTGTKGVRPSCGDCHIPQDNLISETWVHATKGAKDIIGQIVHDYDDPAVRAARRVGLAYQVRDWMKANDSSTCRSCHDANLIAPVAAKGREAHEEMVKTGEKTCIQCHFNLVHAPVEPRLAFIRDRKGN